MEHQRSAVGTVFGGELRREVDEDLPAVEFAVAGVGHVDGRRETKGAQRRLGRQQLDHVEQRREFQRMPR